MRSSVACHRCRRSKVKCVNSGTDAPCKTCESSGRPCTYPDPAQTSRKREGSFSGARPEGLAGAEGEKRARPRKSTTSSFVLQNGTSTKYSPRPEQDALNPRLLTPTVWKELFAIFKQHYSADLPFLHERRIMQPLEQQGSMHPPPTENGPDRPLPALRPAGSDEFLLAFLALTARFHPGLIDHHCPAAPKPEDKAYLASEYYASAASARLGNLRLGSKEPELDRVQALLMFGFHEWGMNRCLNGWLAVGTATRLAQAMSLPFEDEGEDEMLPVESMEREAKHLGIQLKARKPSHSPRDPEQETIDQEIRRRTFWSCFIMDRFLSSGKHRPQMLHVDEFRVQLPASEDSFLYGEKKRTLMLDHNGKGTHSRPNPYLRRSTLPRISDLLSPSRTDAPSPQSLTGRDHIESNIPLEAGGDEGLVSKYVKILEIYGRVMRWGSAGGRRNEKDPPWSDTCGFFILERLCKDFSSDLSQRQRLSPTNTLAHFNRGTSTPYMLMHMVHLVCLITLHRQYVPFICSNVEKPCGPVDEPTFPPEKYDTPAGYWEDSANTLFKACRDIVELAEDCKKHNVWVDTPITGFAVFMAGFCGVYAGNWPQMDPAGHMCNVRADRRDPRSQEIVSGSKRTRCALDTLGGMSRKWTMAKGWSQQLSERNSYYKHWKKDRDRNVRRLEESSESGDSPDKQNLSLREGGAGGGLSEWKLIEDKLTEFGSFANEDVEMSEVGRRPQSRNSAITSEPQWPAAIKDEDANDSRSSAVPSQATQSGFSAINDPSRHGSISGPTNGLSHQQQQQPDSGRFRHFASSQPPQGQSQFATPNSATSYSAATPAGPPSHSSNSQGYGGAAWPQDSNFTHTHGHMPYVEPAHPPQLYRPANYETMQVDIAYPTPGGHSHLQTYTPMPPPWQQRYYSMTDIGVQDIQGLSEGVTTHGMNSTNPFEDGWAPGMGPMPDGPHNGWSGGQGMH